MGKLRRDGSIIYCMDLPAPKEIIWFWLKVLKREKGGYSLSKVSTFGIFIISGLMLRSGEIGAAAEAWPVGIFGLLAGGNSALALAMTVISNLLGILIVPFSISKFIADGVGVSVPTKQLLRSLVVTLLIPLILGKTKTTLFSLGSKRQKPLILIETTDLPFGKSSI
uniref:Sodium/metabolite cotransporter BASS4, chloroplastic n=1 Tax=Vitis vinifera TaxID=29760 RepID=A5ADM0_VITVI|nr:hypothetical protein VITISV_017152 [Vitis vinifera]